MTILKRLKNLKIINKNINFSIFPKEEEYNNNDEFYFLSKIKPKGLKNLGGTCYMNATLQCFYHIKEFTSYFLINKKEIKRKNGLLTNGLLDMIEGLSKTNNSNYYSAYKFKKNLIEIDDIFEGNEGKDSKDLVETILTYCQEELSGDSDFPDFTIDPRDERLMYLDLYYKNSQADSIIMKLFNFETRNETICTGCGVKCYNIACENMLSFSLETIYKFLTNNKIHNNDSKRKIISVDECLTFYSINNSIRENVFCQYCKKENTIISITGFITLPEIFIMVMSRGHREKFECEIDFKEEIDLIDLYVNMDKIKKERSTKYTLLGGTILYGSKGNGHTVAFCKHFDNQYYIFNDSSFYKTSFNKIKNQKVYLLFYQKNK